ncbi:MAG: ATP-binding protein [Pseudomonadota bacterium]
MTTAVSGKLPKVLLSLLMMALAIALLGSLLLLSSNPNQTEYRNADTALRYLQDVTDALAQSLDVAVRPELDVREELTEVARAFGAASSSLGSDLGEIYREEAPRQQLQRMLMRGFNAIDQDQQQLADPGTVRALRDEVTAQTATLEETLVALAQRQHELADATATFATRSRTMVNDLRDRNRNALADETFRFDQLVQEQLEAREPIDLTVMDRVVDKIRADSALTDDNRSALEALVTEAERLRDSQMATIELAQATELGTLGSAIERLRDAVTSDYLALLSVVNEARILLNIFTVLLLGVLAYFGFRLSRSYSALEHSHDDLEQRVQERTADLEKAMLELKESQVQLVQAEKMSSLGQLVAGVMHEINTPLLYVQSNTSVTAEMVEDLKGYIDATLPLVKAASPEEVEAAMKALVSQREALEAELVDDSVGEIVTLSQDSIEGLNQISELVQSLKDFSRLDRAAEDRFDVREGLEKTLTITRNMLKYGVEVEKDFQEVPDIFCAPSRINQVFINLVTNAVQAMDGKGTLRLETRSVDDRVEVTVADTGCGIPQENLNKIMDPFFTTKPVGQGTGLGLSIVHKIVQEHGGRLDIDSAVGKGTRITLSFPLRAGATIAANAEEAA